MKRPLLSLDSLLPGNARPLIGAPDPARCTVHKLADDAAPNPEDNPMPKPKTSARQRILDALAGGPKTAHDLQKLKIPHYSGPLATLCAASQVERTGARGSYVYSLPGAAPAKPARVKVKRSTDQPARLSPVRAILPSFPVAEPEPARPLNLEVAAAPARAILKADGGCLIVRGSTITCEISAADLELVRQL